MTEYWLTIGLAAITGGLIGAAATVWGVARNIEQKSVIEERQKWREALRDLVPRVVGVAGEEDLSKVRDSIVLRLNPYQDQHAILLMDQHLTNPSRESGLLVVSHFQEMLKRDWERAKIESSFFPFRARWRADRGVDRQAQSARNRAKPH